jgi:hypothetical protein
VIMRPAAARARAVTTRPAQAISAPRLPLAIEASTQFAPKVPYARQARGNVLPRR